MKKIICLLPFLSLSLLASCNKGGGDKPEKVEFMLSSEQPTTVVDKTATIYVDWKPTDHSIKFESFTFATTPSKDNTVTFDQTDDPRPVPVIITFTDEITESINGTLSFTYEDITAKTTGNSSLEVTINKPEPTKKWYEYENWWNYCSNGITDNEATAEDIGKEVIVNVYGLDHKVRLIGVDHVNAEGEEPEAHCTFEFENVITNSSGAVTTKWNVKEPKVANIPNNNNFPDSTLNDFLNNDDKCILKALPIDLQGAIKEVNKKVGLGSTYSTDTPYKTKLFPLAHDEIAIHSSGVPDGEGKKYKYYFDHPNQVDRIKRKVGIETGDGETYWLRSPRVDEDNDAWFVNNQGDFHYSLVYNVVYAIAPAFCI